MKTERSPERKILCLNRKIAVLVAIALTFWAVTPTLADDPISTPINVHPQLLDQCQKNLDLAEAKLKLSLAPGQRFQLRNEIEVESLGQGRFYLTKGQDWFIPAPMSIMHQPDWYFAQSDQFPFPQWLIYVPQTNQPDTEFIIFTPCPESS